MYIRKSTRSHKGKTYTNYLLVESILTPKGPRQRAICSLGNLAPAPPEEWLALARKLESALGGQLSLDAGDEKVDALVEAVRRGRKRKSKLVSERGGETITIDADRVEMEDAREAGISARGAPDVAASGSGRDSEPGGIAGACVPFERSDDIEPADIPSFGAGDAGMDPAYSDR